MKILLTLAIIINCCCCIYIACNYRVHKLTMKLIQICFYTFAALLIACLINFSHASESTTRLELCYNNCLKKYLIERNNKCITWDGALKLDDQMSRCFLPCDILLLIGKDYQWN